MRIAIDVSAIAYGTGVSDYTSELVAHLPVETMVPFGFTLRRTLPIGKSFPIPPTLMHFLWNKLHIIQIETFVGGVDIYHSSDWTQGPSKAKKVTTVHDLSPFLYPTELDPQIVSVHTAKMQWVAKECDAIICVSQSTANDLKRLFKIPDSKITVIPEALPTRFLLKPQITKYTNYVFAIGARQPRKNIARLERVCQKLGRKLITVGEGSAMGYVSDQQLVNLLAGADAFVYPSLYEGFGLPILVAFHHQVPVATSNTSSMSEVAGDAAIYFDPESEEEIAKAIADAIADKKDLVAKGTKQLAKFSWQDTADQTLKVYQNLVS